MEILQFLRNLEIEEKIVDSLTGYTTHLVSELSDVNSAVRNMRNVLKQPHAVRNAASTVPTEEWQDRCRVVNKLLQRVKIVLPNLGRFVSGFDGVVQMQKKLESCNGVLQTIQTSASDVRWFFGWC